MRRFKFWLWLVSCAVAGWLFLTSCRLPQVSAASRIFLNLSLEFLGDYSLAPTDVAGLPFVGIADLAYDQKQGILYGLGNDRDAPRLYRLRVDLEQAETGRARFSQVTIDDVTQLRDPQPSVEWSAFAPKSVALALHQAVFGAGDVQTEAGKRPAIAPLNLATGAYEPEFRLPSHFFPAAAEEAWPQGMGENNGFKALAMSPEGDRLFTATQVPLIQDEDGDHPESVRYCRLLHYGVGDIKPLLFAEHLYPLEPSTSTDRVGLTDLVTVDTGGHFLSLERSSSRLGDSVKVFQIALSGASDTAQIDRLKFPLTRIRPIVKQPLLDLSQLEIPLDNFETMALGPPLSDGSRSLLLVSNNDRNPERPTRFLLFRLTQRSRYPGAR